MLTTPPAATVRPFASPPVRDSGIDRLRGIAVALMLLDHALIVAGHPGSGVRSSLTRAAMPLFFVLAGHLVRRLTWRHAAVCAVGLLLPVVVPFIDYAPNVLVIYAFGAVLLWAAARLPARLERVALVFLIGVPLTLAANGRVLEHGPASYAPWALWAFMALGKLLPRSTFSIPAPRVFAALGRYPLSVYVASSLLLTGIAHA